MKNKKNLKIEIPECNTTILNWNIFKKINIKELERKYGSINKSNSEFLNKELLNRWQKHLKESLILNY
jgi:hypothetical protein